MNRSDHIWNHPAYKDEYEALQKMEKDRIFCRHDLQHFLDVARIMMILTAKEGAPFDQELIYAAALLHDIGKAAQYRDGKPHEKAGAELAEMILRDCGFTQKESTMIREAILSHRKAPSRQQEGKENASFSALLYRADKKSRPCYSCPAAEECDWPAKKRNLSIEI